eukprot:365718-Chlamydomonas_euryale.AAC.7
MSACLPALCGWPQNTKEELPCIERSASTRSKWSRLQATGRGCSLTRCTFSPPRNNSPVTLWVCVWLG